MSETAPPTPLALALGRVPTGLFVVTTAGPDGPLGFIGSFLTQVGIDPPTLCVAVGTERGPLPALRASGRFGVSILGDGDRGVMGAFFKKHEPGAGPFDELAVEAAPGGSPVLSDALAWLECRIEGEHATGDHVVLFGTVEAGNLGREGDPAVHLRKSGLGY
jgi:flavin reductase (DIM6/NTAB) family NADH-FMN oxidoreductase RutF